MRKLLLCLICLSIVFAALGCVKNNDPIGFRGEITELKVNDDIQQVTILVEGEPDENVSYDKAYVAITAKSKISFDENNEALSSNELKVGLTVEGVFEGPVAESYPVQGTAKSIKIIR